jgi:uncharacterized protein with von Willebrand factor type A (vWA) domain
LQQETLDTTQRQRAQVISRKVRSHVREGADPGWAHEQVQIKAVNSYAVRKKVAWRVKMRPSMRTEH